MFRCRSPPERNMRTTTSGLSSLSRCNASVIAVASPTTANPVPSRAGAGSLREPRRDHPPAARRSSAPETRSRERILARPRGGQVALTLYPRPARSLGPASRRMPRRVRARRSIRDPCAARRGRPPGHRRQWWFRTAHRPYPARGPRELAPGSLALTRANVGHRLLDQTKQSQASHRIQCRQVAIDHKLDAPRETLTPIIDAVLQGRGHAERIHFHRSQLGGVSPPTTANAAIAYYRSSNRHGARRRLSVRIASADRDCMPA